MLQIVSGSLDEIRSELKKLIASKRKEVAILRNDLSETRKELALLKKKYPKKDRSHEIDVEIARLESAIETRKEKIEAKAKERDFAIEKLSPSKLLPVQVGEIVINYKLYESMMKKLKGFKLEFYLLEDKLSISYSNIETKGEFELYDISKFVEGIENFPIAEIKERPCFYE